ncbi:MAG: right-handed parallel beta-helix repeat-containing protein [Acidobacteria bacterium]|nr:right-handed parallel beta-helix repeat-containing protein [Acidobacteriota bacterium]
MKKFRFVLLIAIGVLFAGIADAQATRTWVSGVGDDVNPCSRTAPCKTFAGAISKTATNGEINCLDPGGFGAVTITKSITIDCSTDFGSILSSGTNGIVINITAAADTKKAVRLRGVSINGAGTGLNGIRILSALSVSVENVTIDGMTSHGISVESNLSPKITVVDSTFRGNTGNGINTFVTTGTVNLSVADAVFSSNNIGINLSGSTKATVRDSSMVNNLTGVTASNADIGVFHCLVSGNSTGFSALAGGNIRLSDNMVTSNTTGLSISGGVIASFGNNMINANTTDGAPNAFGSLN